MVALPNFCTVITLATRVETSKGMCSFVAVLTRQSIGPSQELPFRTKKEQELALYICLSNARQVGKGEVLKGFMSYSQERTAVILVPDLLL